MPAKRRKRRTHIPKTVGAAIRQVAALLRPRRWVSSQIATDELGVRVDPESPEARYFSIGGAVQRICLNDLLAVSVMDTLRDAIAALDADMSVTRWETTPRRKLAQVLRLLRAAPAYVRKPQNVQIKQRGKVRTR
jgi:hypothetical protein